MFAKNFPFPLLSLLVAYLINPNDKLNFILTIIPVYKKEKKEFKDISNVKLFETVYYDIKGWTKNNFLMIMSRNRTDGWFTARAPCSRVLVQFDLYDKNCSTILPSKKFFDLFETHSSYGCFRYLTTIKKIGPFDLFPEGPTGIQALFNALKCSKAKLKIFCYHMDQGTLADFVLLFGASNFGGQMVHLELDMSRFAGCLAFFSAVRTVTQRTNKVQTLLLYNNFSSERRTIAHVARHEGPQIAFATNSLPNLKVFGTDLCQGYTNEDLIRLINEHSLKELALVGANRLHFHNVFPLCSATKLANINSLSLCLNQEEANFLTSNTIPHFPNLKILNIRFANNAKLGLEPLVDLIHTLIRDTNPDVNTLEINEKTFEAGPTMSILCRALAFRNVTYERFTNIITLFPAQPRNGNKNRKLIWLKVF